MAIKVPLIDNTVLNGSTSVDLETDDDITVPGVQFVTFSQLFRVTPGSKINEIQT